MQRLVHPHTPTPHDTVPHRIASLPIYEYHTCKCFLHNSLHRVEHVASLPGKTTLRLHPKTPLLRRWNSGSSPCCPASPFVCSPWPELELSLPSSSLERFFAAAVGEGCRDDPDVFVAVVGFDQGMGVGSTNKIRSPAKLYSKIAASCNYCSTVCSS